MGNLLQAFQAKRSSSAVWATRWNPFGIRTLNRHNRILVLRGRERQGATGGANFTDLGDNGGDREA